MKDLTQGSVTKHLLHMSAFMAVSMIAQTLYLLLDMYWVAHLGKEAIAAVGVAGAQMMIVVALTQMLGVGTTALIAQAAGRKDQPHAELAFNQSFVMSILVGLALGICGFGLIRLYCNTFSADSLTASLARSYLYWFIPALVLQFPLISLGSALRATGIVQPTVALQLLSVILNAILAPFLILGIGFPRLGVGGAALATFISILISAVLLFIYFEKKYHYLRFRSAQFWPQMKMWWAMLRIGLPAGAEFVLLFVYITLVYKIIVGFGPAAQAGFGLGVRVMQSLFLPLVALSLAVSPMVGQNFGGRKPDRVRHSVYSGLASATILMLILATITWLNSAGMIRIFAPHDDKVIAFGSDYLRIVAFNFVAAGIVFTSSSAFQGLGNTLPPLLSSASRLIIFALPAVIISHRGGFDIKLIWYLSVASQILQACFNLLLLRFELHKKLKFEDGADFISASATAS